MQNKIVLKYLGLNQDQKSILIGSLLGDGHLRRNSNNSNTTFSIKRSLADKDYLKYQYDYFKDFCSNPIREKSTIDKRTNKTYHSCSFETLSYSDFNYFHNLWYQGKKIIPKLELDSLSIAIWFFDDGTLSYNKRFKGSFATNSFSKDEVYYLKTLLDDRYNVKFNLANKNNQYIIQGFDHQFQPLLEDIDKYSYFLPRKSNIWKNRLSRSNTKSNNCIEKSILILEKMIELKSFNKLDLAKSLNLIYCSKKGNQIDSTLNNKIKKYLFEGKIVKKNDLLHVIDLSNELERYLEKKKYY